MPDDERGEVLDAVAVDDDDQAKPGSNAALAPIDSATPEQIQQGMLTLYGTSDPVALVEQVGKVATELKKVIDTQRLTADIPGRDKPFVEVEGWQICGAFHGVTPHVVAVEAVEPMRGFGVKRETKKWGKHPESGKWVVIEEVKDVWMAKGCSYRVWCEARRLDGAVVGRGVGFCSREESAKIYADEYEVMGMAATRAVSRTMRQSFGWVVAMAGYETTPASEMAQAPPNQGGPPFGPELTDEPLIQKAKEAVAYLLVAGDEPPDEAAAEQVWAEIEKDCSGYMPGKVARGLMWAAAELKKKVDGGGDEPVPGDDDKPADGGGDGDGPTTLPEVDNDRQES